MVKKITSKYDQNNYFLYKEKNNRLSGIVIKLNKFKRKLLTNNEYFIYENKRYELSFDSSINNLYYSISNQSTIINNIFRIGSRKLLNFIRKKSKIEENAKILLYLYYIEQHKYNTRLFINKRGKKKQIINIIKEITSNNFKYLDVSVSPFFLSYIYEIKYKEYIFVIKLPKNNNFNYYENKWNNHYINEPNQFSKLFDIIYDEYKNDLIKLK